MSLSPPKPTSTACIAAAAGDGRPWPGVATKKSATRGGRPSPGTTSAKPPAPGPVSGLSVTQAAKAAATHASTAFPPSASTRAPASAVSRCPAAIAPFMFSSLQPMNSVRARKRNLHPFPTNRTPGPESSLLKVPAMNISRPKLFASLAALLVLIGVAATPGLLGNRVGLGVRRAHGRRAALARARGARLRARRSRAPSAPGAPRSAPPAAGSARTAPPRASASARS